MGNSVVVFGGVRGYEQDGVAFLHIEDVARGLGFTYSAASGNEVVRWNRVEEYLNTLGFVATSGDAGNPHDYYIPENIFYRLCMKARNEVAEAFQAKVADEIIPSIRKTGSYSVTPKTYLEALKALVASEEAKEAAQKALAAEKEQHEADNRDFCNGLDILNRKKAEISTRREATCMNKVAQVNRENRRLNDENGNLKDQVGRGQNWKTISEMRKEWFGAFGHEPSWKMLKSISAEIGIAPIKDVLEFMTDRFGRSQERKVNRYHNEVWKRYEAYERSIQG